MGGASRGQTTVTQTAAANEPWGPTQGYLTNNLANVQSFYNSPAANRTYSGSTVVPFSNNSQQGMGLMREWANNSRRTMEKPLSAFSGMMDSVQPLAQGNFGGTIYEGAQDLRDTLSPIAMGDFSRDTTFQNTLGAAQRNAAQQVNMAMSGAGRYGSGVHTDRMVDTIGDMTNRAMLDRQQMGINAFRGLTGDLAGGQQTAANQLMGFGQAMPEAYAAALAPGQTLRSLGEMEENLSGNYLQAELDKFNAPTDLVRRNLAEQNALYSGIGKLGGSASGTESVRTPGMSSGEMAGMGLAAGGRVLGKGG